MNHSPLQDDTTSSENKDLLLPSSSGSKGVLIEEAGIDEEATWVEEADPLTTRHLPSSTEAAIIEEMDIRRTIEQNGEDLGALNFAPSSASNDAAFASSSPRSSMSQEAQAQVPGPKLEPTSAPRRPRVPGRLRLLLILLVAVAVLALATDGVLVFLAVTHHHSHANVPKAFPMLTITPGTVHTGQIVLLHIDNFPASTHVLLTHDTQEAVQTDRNSSLIKLGANGEADVRLLIDDSWGPGFHMIVAEGTTTHYTASAILQVVSELPLRPPHLLVSLPGQINRLQGSLNMGAEMQGANTLQSLVLRNTGGSWISWSATSNQPWLMTSPQQGIFRDGQSIFVALTSANLKPGDYSGTITIVSNAGGPVTIQVKMTILQLPASAAAASPVMVITPPVLSFSSTDGGADPAARLLTISNSGSQPLSWSLAAGAVQNAFNQNLYSQDNVNWLSTNTTSGVLSPGESAKIQVNIHSQDLLPGVYSALLTFTSGRDTLNSPQMVAVSLTVQSRCGVATNVGGITFTAFAGQSTAASQPLSLSTTSGCTSRINWQTFSSANWLSIAPANGQLQVDVSIVTTVKVNVDKLQPGKYTGFMLFLTDLRSETLMVQLTVLPPSSTAAGQPTGPTSPGSSSTPTSGTGTSPATAATLGVMPLRFQFTATQGQNNPPSQSLSISNTGGSSLYWQANFNSSASPWLSITPIGGTIVAGQTMQITVSVNAAGLAPGNYTTQFTVTATDSSGKQVQGSPQTIPVTLTVLPACSLQVAPSSLSFTASLLQPNPLAQNIVLQERGNCVWPISWTASVNAGSQKWLIISATSGTDSGSGSTIVVHVNTRGMVVGIYNGQITLSATESNGGVVQNARQTVSVTLTVIL